VRIICASSRASSAKLLRLLGFDAGIIRTTHGEVEVQRDA
jgi:hypothetical protein